MYCIILTDAENKWISPNYVEANVGEDITYTCRTRMPITYFKFNYNSTLPENAVITNKTLTITNIRQNNSGLYHCFGKRETRLQEFKALFGDKYFVATATLKVFGKFIIVL